MGIELDVLVGHPEHELLFVATQVARAAGLKSPHYSASVCASAVGHKEARQLGTLEIPKTLIPKAMQGSSWFFTESTIYRMLMRGSTEKAKAFQTWLAEEVLPTIRKTGQYNAAESSDPIAVGIMDAGVAKTLTMAARSQRPYEDHYHDPAHSTRTTSPPRRSRNRHHPSY